MRIARVFPTRTSYTPTDPHAYYDVPDMFTPQYDEVHVSCTFTWDKSKALDLACAWGKKAPKVRIGGVAIDGESDKPFVSGMYIKKGVTITSRGCPNNCSFCMVRRGLIELEDFPEGNIVQDNNILACSDRHWSRVMNMLTKQRGIEFKGGLDKYLINQKRAEDLRSLSVKTLWLACDQANGIEPLRKAVAILNKVGFTRSHLYCYVLIGDNARENIHRLREVWKIGCMPFAQLLKNKDNTLEYTRSWKRFQRRWAKPMIIRKRNADK